ncbi:hypothetical protein FACS189447_03110 [Spirochaetia bacterium]|nr:hypothetical protein FACS189447_03110 [Spirochaetia bacterium]
MNFWARILIKIITMFVVAFFVGIILFVCRNVPNWIMISVLAGLLIVLIVHEEYQEEQKRKARKEAVDDFLKFLESVVEEEEKIEGVTKDKTE